MATEESLYNCVNRAIVDEQRRVKRVRQAHPRVKHRITDYTAAVVACGCINNNRTFSGYSASPNGHHFSEKIRVRLESLAPIGSKRKECKNIIGACAEPHAADKVIKACPACNITQLQFSDAYRPRTGRRIRYCQNCKDTFPDVL